MRAVSWFVSALFAGVASAANAQTPTESHEQHQATGQHQVAGKGEKCCCEEMMRKMMMEMMQKHQGMGIMAPKDARGADAVNPKNLFFQGHIAFVFGRRK